MLKFKYVGDQWVKIGNKLILGVTHKPELNTNPIVIWIKKYTLTGAWSALTIHTIPWTKQGNDW